MSRKILFNIAVVDHPVIEGQIESEIVLEPEVILAENTKAAERVAFMKACEAEGFDSCQADATSAWEILVVPF